MIKKNKSTNKDLNTTKGKLCSICGTEINGRFCHNCGQRITGKKTGFIDIWKALSSGLFHIERGILGVIYELSINPKKVIHNYWEGNRYFYLSPGQMIFYTIFALGLHITFISGEYILGVSVKGEVSEVSILTPQLFLVVLILPLYALTTFLSYFKKRKTFPEHFISATYVFSYGAILSTSICDFIYLVFGFPLNETAAILLLILFIWGSRIFVAKRKWYNYLLGVVIQMLVFLLLVALLVAILFLYTGGKGFKRI
jgi:hypothetical protein